VLFCRYLQTRCMSACSRPVVFSPPKRTASPLLQDCDAPTFIVRHRSEWGAAGRQTSATEPTFINTGDGGRRGFISTNQSTDFSTEPRSRRLLLLSSSAFLTASNRAAVYAENGNSHRAARCRRGSAFIASSRGASARATCVFFTRRVKMPAAFLVPYRSIWARLDVVIVISSFE
jgi:hypothetical protein